MHSGSELALDESILHSLVPSKLQRAKPYAGDEPQATRSGLKQVRPYVLADVKQRVLCEKAEVWQRYERGIVFALPDGADL